MKFLLSFFILTFLTVRITRAQKTDLSSRMDTVRPLANPIYVYELLPGQLSHRN